jgi:hypothetical protein
MYDSEVTTADLIAEIKDEIDIASIVPDTAFLRWLNTVEQTVYTELILTNPTNGEIVEQEDSDVKISYRFSENDEWAEVTKGEFEISNDMENSQIYLKYEYVGKDGCYLPLTAESEIIPADYIHEREYPNAGAHWIFLGIVVGIIWIAGYVITPLIMICAIVFVLILLALGGISTVLLTAGIITLVIVLIVKKRNKSNKV